MPSFYKIPVIIDTCKSTLVVQIMQIELLVALECTI